MRSTAVRLGSMLIALVLAGCSTAAPSVRPSTRPAGSGPAESAAAVETPGDSVATEARVMLVDTDVAADDLIALAFLASSTQVQLVGITVSGTGEAHCPGGVDVVLRLLDRLDAPDIPVACGRETPLAGSHTFPDAWREHVDQGSGLELEPTARTPSSSTAVELIAALATEHESLTALMLGPLTNLADALLQDPALAEQIGPVFVMGGALHVPGNLVCCGAPEGNSVAEWNVYVDPRAANVVVDSGITPSFVSLDGTNQVPLTQEFAGRVMEPTDSAAVGVVAELFEANPFMTDGSYYLWDPLAAQLAAGYQIGSFGPACIVVEEAEGPESGFTRPTCGTPNIRYLTTVDPAAAEATMLGVLSGDRPAARPRTSTWPDATGICEL
jgi:pyrimidine-specific ribonucleoside hydrolase